MDERQQQTTLTSDSMNNNLPPTPTEDLNCSNIQRGNRTHNTYSSTQQEQIISNFTLTHAIAKSFWLLSQGLILHHCQRRTKIPTDDIQTMRFERSGTGSMIVCFNT